MSTKDSAKKRKLGALPTVLALCLGGIFLFSLYHIIDTVSAYAEGANTYSRLASEVVSLKYSLQLSSDNDESAENKADAVPISVDFDALLAVNEDVAGWLYCEGTPINYPVLQTTDNDYYLRRMINKEYNIAGSVFMDYRSRADLNSLNTIIYGHNMNDDSMFGTFTYYKEQEYYDKHPVIWFLTPNAVFKIELIAGFVTDCASEAYTDFTSSDELNKYVGQVLAESTFYSAFDMAAVDSIVTLSTCSYEYSTARYVLIGAAEQITDTHEIDE